MKNEKKNYIGCNCCICDMLKCKCCGKVHRPEKDSFYVLQRCPKHGLNYQY